MAGPPPPPGPPIELTDEYVAETNLPRILGIITTFQVLSLVVVILRLYVRIKLIRSLGRDDWTMSAAVVCALGGWGMFIFQAFNGLGRHEATLSDEQKKNMTLAIFLFSIISSAWGVALLKVSIALNLLRLSKEKWYTWSLWCSLAFVCLYSFLGMFPFLLYCKPMNAYWDRSIVDAKCYSVKLFIAFGLINSALNIFTDVLFASFPVPIIWKLQMKRKTKYYLIVILALGYVAVALGVVKSEAQINYSPFADNSFDNWIPFWATLQLNLGIIAACAPSLKPLVSKMLSLTSYGRSNYNSGYGSQSRGPRPGPGSSLPRSRHQYDEYGSEEMQSWEGSRSEEGEAQQKPKSTVTVEVYSAANPERSGSEDMILNDLTPQRRGSGKILRTTDISVR